MFDPDFWRSENPRDARAKIVETVRYELLGPSSPDEVLDESPISRYLVGMLAPFGTDVPPEEQDDDANDVEEDVVAAPDLAPPLSQALSPSSIGLSCLVPEGTRRLAATVSWGDYERMPESSEPAAEQPPAGDETAGDEDGASARPRRPRRRDRWLRHPTDHSQVEIEIRADAAMQREQVTEGDEIWVEHVARTLPGGRVALSVFLVNRRERETDKRPPANLWIFQPELILASPDGSEIFLPRDLGPELTRTDRDLESNELLYRDRREFAIGHGAAVTWSGSRQGASKVGTVVLPDHEVPRVAPFGFAAGSLDMEVLSSELPASRLRELLSPLADGYAEWLARKRAEAQQLPVTLRSTAADHLNRCDAALDRLRGGIELLETDSSVRAAFAFANRAMLLQRGHTIWAQQRRDPGRAPARPELSGTWRPFQLAFILLNLRSIADPHSEERTLGDLLWFPTGGGKTEAYLGLAAFTLAMRRLRSDDTLRTDAGVTVLMRYTLRLLTIQQFQRASALICACEVLRREAPQRWGQRRFSVGLWLGRKATPNSHEGSRRALDRLRRGETPEESSPCQLEDCPWCGEPLGLSAYEADVDRLRTIVTCPRDGCDFDGSRGELPVLLVDEEIYRECPSLLIATVDKFAQMPWNGEIASIFGRVDRECQRCGFLTPTSRHPRTHRRNGRRSSASQLITATERLAPPELIIQDELHLISGPLGTMVGLYETAVDALCSRTVDGALVRPKVIASTATIRRAFEQVQSLFDRNLRVFPPPALDPADSFFAFEQPVDDVTPGRLHVGVLAPGKSLKTALVRVSAALLSAGAGLRTADPRMADPYLTLVSYFNSLRELGGTVRLMEDDIGARLRQLRNRGLPQRNRPVYEELTSRVPSERIPTLLRRLGTAHDAPRGDDDPLPLDAVLASNMIGVGVDVDRLALMTVLGQPKATAEYLQATGRVGRQQDAPGLVVTIYNWVRPRDLSHYERFCHYHSTLYRHVEAVSVTPFSSRARDRGLAGAFVALTRLADEHLNAENDANRFDAADSSYDVALATFRSRAARIVDEATARELENAIRARADAWSEFARSPLRYGWRQPHRGSQPPPSDVLLRASEWPQFGHWKAPGSLREVEVPSQVYTRELDGS